MKLDIDQITQVSFQYGLVLRGGLCVKQEDQVPGFATGGQTKTLLLFGNAGSSIWPHFSQSTEYLDGNKDPLNRWSERIGNELAQSWGGIALFPFGGPPYQPFLRWAKKAEQIDSSTLGMLIHPEYGLWHAYRFAIALSMEMDLEVLQPKDTKYACGTCANKPCLAGCPVGAFESDSYDLKKCFDYLDSHPGSSCHQQGCQARVACPEGQGYRYQSAHAEFHMEKFVQAMALRFNQP